MLYQIRAVLAPEIIKIYKGGELGGKKPFLGPTERGATWPSALYGPAPTSQEVGGELR